MTRRWRRRSRACRGIMSHLICCTSAPRTPLGLLRAPSPLLLTRVCLCCHSQDRAAAAPAVHGPRARGEDQVQRGRPAGDGQLRRGRLGLRGARVPRLRRVLLDSGTCHLPCALALAVISAPACCSHHHPFPTLLFCLRPRSTRSTTTPTRSRCSSAPPRSASSTAWPRPRCCRRRPTASRPIRSATCTTSSSTTRRWTSTCTSPSARRSRPPCRSSPLPAVLARVASSARRVGRRRTWRLV